MPPPGQQEECTRSSSLAGLRKHYPILKSVGNRCCKCFTTERSEPRTFVDSVRVRTTGGRGGDGCVAFESDAPGSRRPAGGNGGVGGNVYIVADRKVRSLTFERHHYNGGHGGQGGGAKRKGRSGADTYLRVPCGTVVTEVEEVIFGWDPVKGWGGQHEEMFDEEDDMQEQENSKSDGEEHSEEEELSDEEFSEDEEFSDEEEHSAEHEEHSAEHEEHSDAEYSDEEHPEEFDDNNNEHPDSIKPHPAHRKKLDTISATEAATELSNRMTMDVPPEWEGDEDPAISRPRTFQPHGSGEEERELLKVDLSKHGDKVMVAEGGRPGLGNQIMAGSRRRKSMSPKKLPGAEGETREYELVLKTIADVGLVGYPNAGKSTLLGAMSHAHPKTAAYPFTTLKPHVGHLEYSDAVQLTMADIPGLIDGAHMNKGLGFEFLRHIERTKVLVYVIDVAGSEGRDPCNDFKNLREELRIYDSSLLQRPSLVVANKIDDGGAEKNLARLREVAAPLAVFPVCAFFAEGVQDVAISIRELFETVSADR